MVGHGGSSASSYLVDPTSPIPSHCASIAVTSTLRVNPYSLVLCSLYCVTVIIINNKSPFTTTCTHCTILQTHRVNSVPHLSTQEDSLYTGQTEIIESWVCVV